MNFELFNMNKNSQIIWYISLIIIYFEKAVLSRNKFFRTVSCG